MGRVALIRRCRATFSQWEKDLPTLFKAYLGQLWSQTAPTIFNFSISDFHRGGAIAEVIDLDVELAENRKQQVRHRGVFRIPDMSPALQTA